MHLTLVHLTLRGPSGAVNYEERFDLQFKCSSSLKNISPSVAVGVFATTLFDSNRKIWTALISARVRVSLRHRHRLCNACG